MNFAFDVGLVLDPGDPSTFKEATQGVEKEKWLPSAKDEVLNFLNRKAWKKKKRSKVFALGRKPVPVKWVFKKKLEQDKSTRYKSRIVVKGYMQIPGVDYSESFSPVVNDTTTRVVLGLTLHKQHELDDWICEMFDVEAAFLNATLDIPMYLEWPEGMVELGFITAEEEKDYVIQLMSSMYGNVDAALKWWKLFVKVAQGIKFDQGTKNVSQSVVDPCLLYMKDDDGELVLLIIVHVDDAVISGREKYVREFMRNFNKEYKITELGKMKKHLGIWYEWHEDAQGPYVKASTPELAASIVKKFVDVMGREPKEAATPGFPGKCLRKNEGEEVLKAEYMSLVGKCMYYVIKISPECANPIRELAQHLKSPGEEHWKALERFCGYVKRKPYHGLTFRKPRELRSISYADANYATDVETRKSVTGNLHTLGGMLTNWMSKTQNSVTLSTTESEYVSLSTCAQETVFTNMLLDEVAKCERPGVIYEDNTGAIFLVKNKQVGMRTKHIDVRAHFIRDLHGKDLRVIYEKTDENPSDLLTKNVTEKLHEKHTAEMVSGNLKCWREDVKFGDAVEGNWESSNR